jgi:hypothetical protein
MVITSFTGLAALLMASIYFIMYLLMIKKFGERFTEQALLAAQNWATHARVEQNSNWNRPSPGTTGGIANPEIL